MATLAGCSSPVLALNRTALRVTHPRTVSAPRLAGPACGAGLKYISFPCGPDDLRARVQDPATMIRVAVVEALAKRFSLDVVERGSPDLVLEIETTYWAVVNTGSQYIPGTFVLYYEGSLKLTDKRTNKLVAEGPCVSHPVDGFKSSRDGEAFSEAIASAVEYCTDDYRHRLLGLF
jgi:hypothetical protein